MSGLGMGESQRKKLVRRLLVTLTITLVFLLVPVVAVAQDAASDSLQTETPETSGGGGLQGARNAAAKAAAEAAAELTPAEKAAAAAAAADSSFFTSFTNVPKSGATASVRTNTYYTELISTLKMKDRATWSNTARWSYDKYRSQNKNIEKRSSKMAYNMGDQLPFMVNFNADWDWSNDKAVNTAGVANLFARDNKSLRLTSSRSKMQTGVFTHSVSFGGSVEDRQSVNQNIIANTMDGNIKGGLQTGWNIKPGLVLAGRIAATATTGNKTLGQKDSPSSASGDSLGLGLYFDHHFAHGRVVISQANFEKKYLDFKKNSNGLIDTTGIADDLKIVDELETRDATTIEFESDFVLGPVYLQSILRRTMDDLDFAVSGQGLKERQMDDVTLSSGARAGVDSLTVTYKYIWKWDDQRLQGATKNRGRQYNKNRELEFVWLRPFFRKTQFRMRYAQSLNQDIAQFVHNQNDKDRLQTDFNLQLDRTWPKRFRAKMLYVYRQSEDMSIRETRSSNNNIKELYEITPSYTWFMAPWLTWDQSYRVFIQYTDYVYSHLETVTREDNYNKRGSLTTKVTLLPTKRLELILRHDYNKKFNATRSGESATGGSVYARDLNQIISKLDVGVKFTMTPGVVLEAATYRTRDERQTFGRVNGETTDYSGELWMGTRVKKTWRQTITLSALVKKYNAFGSSVSKSSANYWQADVWLKWEF